MYVCTLRMYVLYVCMYVLYVLYVCVYVCTLCMYVCWLLRYVGSWWCGQQNDAKQKGPKKGSNRTKYDKIDDKRQKSWTNQRRNVTVLKKTLKPKNI